MFKWLKERPVLLLIFGVVVGLFGLQFVNRLFSINSYSLKTSSVAYPQIANNEMAADSFSGAGTTSLALPNFPVRDAAPVPSDNRLVIQNSNLSLLVNDVRDIGDKVVKHAQSVGGYMVETSYNQPSESPFATITVRIPSDKLDESLAYIRGLGIKVTNENLRGHDVTDEYVDIEERLSILERTKAKYESILANATAVQDVLTVQREIINTQTQIDSLNGQKQYLEQNAALSKVTVYLSTDELALPYTPDEAFRPAVIFKLAVRSLIGTLRWFGEAAIWVAVYAVIWVPALLIYLAYRRWRASKTLKQ